MNKDVLRIEEFLLIICFLMLTIGILWEAKTSDSIENHQVLQVQNLMASPPLPANTYLENYSLYVPQGYNLEIVDNTIVVYNDEAIITFYLGQGVALPPDFFEMINNDLTQLFGRSVAIDGVVTYSYAWEYDKNNIEILLGQNDSYITAIYPKNKLDIGITDITLMFNSYQAIDD